jgi:hypothetical protein
LRSDRDNSLGPLIGGSWDSWSVFSSRGFLGIYNDGRHDDGNWRHNGGYGRHDDRQQGDRWHDDGDERHDDAAKRR